MNGYGQCPNIFEDRNLTVTCDLHKPHKMEFVAPLKTSLVSFGLHPLCRRYILLLACMLSRVLTFTIYLQLPPCSGVDDA